MPMAYTPINESHQLVPIQPRIPQQSRQVTVDPTINQIQITIQDVLSSRNAKSFTETETNVIEAQNRYHPYYVLTTVTSGDTEGHSGCVPQTEIWESALWNQNGLDHAHFTVLKQYIS